MPKVRFWISMSMDGFVAGPNPTVQEPLGIGGENLHEWVFPLKAWRAPHGLEGGEDNESSPTVEEVTTDVGATIMGRNMFGGGPGPWDLENPWNGWWGSSPPFHHPVFVVTHHARQPLVLEGGTSFTFVTNGIEAALEQAKRAANGKHVTIAGGARVAQQYLAAGVVDEMHINLVPILLGGGERLFERLGDNLHGLELVRVVSTLKVIHLKFAKR
jgi:dihydrofolate reductase